MIFKSRHRALYHPTEPLVSLLRETTVIQMETFDEGVSLPCSGEEGILTGWRVRGGVTFLIRDGCSVSR